ncbi:hypothetical protein [Noviherbaspirillum massiliense]|uniref:hypothetical protein n=1 Tax=Noviherbaspirillum massiliense TaxID=1465823 RepID=UPI00030D87AD|nr:hypothetical protein [Noviherbaspirillum massiliense]
MNALHPKEEAASGKQVNASRRRFLSGAKVLGAIGAAALVGKQLEVEASVVELETPEPPATNGYHETEHIRKYYHSARF